MYKQLENLETFSTLDIRFASLMRELGDDSPETTLAAALVCKQSREGNVCLDIGSVAGSELVDEQGEVELLCPDKDTWWNVLSASPLVGSPGEYAPLVFEKQAGRLYLHRYFEHENDVAGILYAMATSSPQNIPGALLQKDLDTLFGSDMSPNWQKVAAATAAVRRLSVISGGPGTGKTTTVAKILALLVKQHPEWTIRLAAPTGKAAARLQESVNLALHQLNWPDEYIQKIPRDVHTIHRLLGAVLNTNKYRYNSKNKLPADLVVVDEASMVDLPLMAALLRALRPSAHLILLGDKDQLASVEAGAVLGDICGRTEPNSFTREQKDFFRECLHTEISGTDATSPFADCVVQLEHVYRFPEESGINKAAKAVKAGKGKELLSYLQEEKYREVNWLQLSSPGQLAELVNAYSLPQARRLLDSDNAEEALAKFKGFRLLSPLRRGPFGVQGLNSLTENLLREQGTISTPGPWYKGRPIMVTCNDYRLGLANGDTGVVWPGENGLEAVFGSQETGSFRLPLLRLPSLETVFALTVHKSQGTEFNDLLLVLPPKDSPVLTRELIYTAITRARQSITIAGTPEVLKQAVQRPTSRTSGLEEKLWEK